MWEAGERRRRTRARHRARGPCVTDLAHCEHRSLVVAVAAAVAAAVAVAGAGAAAEPRRRVCGDLRSRKRWSRSERVLRLVVAAVEATDMWSVVVLCSAAAPVVAGFARCCCCTRRSDHVGCPKKTRESSRRSTEAAYCRPARCHRNVVDAPVDAVVATAGGTGGVCEVALAAPLNARERVPCAYW